MTVNKMSMYSRYRRRLSDVDWPRRKRRIVPILDFRQKTTLILLLCVIIAIPITQFALEHVPLYQQSKAKGFGSILAAEGMSLSGLWKDPNGYCKNAYRILGTTGDQVLCTHGPDPAPAGFTIHTDPSPLLSQPKGGEAFVTCDGDGEHGKRIEAIYVHRENQEDRFTTYAQTLRQYLVDADSIFDISASETGGSRHIRFVHTNDCMPVIHNISFKSTDDTFASTISELQAQGFDRTDRKYIVFMDAHTYCGIGTVVPDDSPRESNKNNAGPSYARIDAGCWSASVVAHELVHMLGGVQTSSPHSSGGWHCVDEYDRMCYSDSPTYPSMQYACDDTNHELLLDCNHDDYFSTNPLKGTYLDAHWNVANSQYLIGASN